MEPGGSMRIHQGSPIIPILCRINPIPCIQGPQHNSLYTSTNTRTYQQKNNNKTPKVGLILDTKFDCKRREGRHKPRWITQDSRFEVSVGGFFYVLKNPSMSARLESSYLGCRGDYINPILSTPVHLLLLLLLLILYLGE